MGAILRALISHAGFVDEVSGDGCVGCGRVAALGDGIRGILSRNLAVPYLSGAHGRRVLGPEDRAGDACPWLVYIEDKILTKKMASFMGAGHDRPSDAGCSIPPRLVRWSMNVSCTDIGVALA